MNNSIKTPIVVTKAEEQEFALRFEANVPKTFSGVIFHAADALEKFVKRDDTRVRMSYWHIVKQTEGKEPVCYACLATAAMIDLCGATGFEVDKSKAGFFDGDRINSLMFTYLRIVNRLRMGAFARTCSSFHNLILESTGVDEGTNQFDSLQTIGHRLQVATDNRRSGSLAYIGCIRRAAEEVKALGL